jgi:hypothetical protein
MSDAELRRYQATPAGVFRAAFGITDEDTSGRAVEIRDQLSLSHRAVYGTEYRISLDAAEQAARAEQGTPWVSCSSAEFARKMRLADPLCAVAVLPDLPSVADGVVVGLKNIAARQ